MSARRLRRALRFGWRVVAGIMRGGWTVVVAREEQVERRGDGTIVVLPRSAAEQAWRRLPGQGTQ